MPKDRKFSAYQQGVIKRYYEHKDTLMNQRLGELVSELYLCKDAKKADRLWQSAEKALLAAGADKRLVHHVIGERNVEGLAEAVAELF
jgi:hypothetical protein